MTLLFDLAHPAHFHLFKNAILCLKESHRILITVRKRDLVPELLDHAGLAYTILAKTRKNYAGLGLEVLERDIRMLQLCKQARPQLLLGSTPTVAHVGKILGIPSLVFSEDDDPTVPIFSYLSYPFAWRIINPNCIAHTHWSQKRIFHSSYHELAYLHPNTFTPDRAILDKYGLKEKEFVIARFSALTAHHDVGHTGISRDVWNEIETLLEKYQVITSIENQSTHTIDPWDMHHILAFAKMIISDSQTMTIEGAVLGIPAVRINTFVGKSTVIEELENTYKLAFGILPSQTSLITQTIQSLLDDPTTDRVWQERRDHLLSEKIDLNHWILDFITRHERAVHHHLRT